MDLPAASSVLAQVTCSWEDGTADAVIVHISRDMLVLEARDPRQVLPPLGTELRLLGETQYHSGRLAEHGRGGRFLVSVGDRPVRRALRMKVSLPGTLRSPGLANPQQVEIVDLTTSGARVRGLELPVGAQVTLDFTPPGREAPVSVRAAVAHGTHNGQQPWIGVVFRLVALRGGR